MEKTRITNPNQFEKLVEGLENNSSFVKGFRKGTIPNDFMEQWDSVATALNALGPPSRTGNEWQKLQIFKLEKYDKIH